MRAVLITVVLVLTICSLTQALQHEEICERQTFRPECKVGEVIVMHKAAYGVMRLGRCVRDNFGYVGCSTDVLSLADRRCSGRQTCEIRVRDPEFEAKSSCRRASKVYLDATYYCTKVAVKTAAGCLLTDTSGNIGNTVTEEGGCGMAETPWQVRAKPGQRLNFTLMDFGTAYSNTTESTHVCHVYMILKESKRRIDLTVCGGSKRVKHVYTSTSNTVDIRVPTGVPGFFLMKYEVLGCPDIEAPRNGWVKSNGNRAVIGCNSPRLTWHLACNGTAWLGKVPICTSSLGCKDIEAPRHGWVKREGNITTAGCDSSEERWYLSCNGSEWLGKVPICTSSLGCPDIEAPRYGWVKRNGNQAAIGCDSSRETWHLSCNGTAWLGKVPICTSSLQHEEICERQAFRPECKVGEVIVMHKAAYGRMRLGRCVREDVGFLGCSTDVLSLADKRCSGRQTCEIRVRDPEFDGEGACPRAFRVYLDATYYCTKVAVKTAEGCLLTDTSGNIGNTVTEEGGCGMADTPWQVRAKPGQRLNFTLMDFGTAYSNTTESTHVCHVYMILKESKRSLTVCAGSKRVKHVYTSISNAVDIRVPTGVPGFFLMKYEVLGCPDIEAPRNGWVKRNGDQAAIGCTSSRETWHLACIGTEWLGDMPICASSRGCKDIEAPKHGWVKREGNITTAGCDSSEERWYLSCNGSEWLGKVPICTSSGRDREQLEELLRRCQLNVREEDGEPLNRLLGEIYDSDVWDLTVRYAQKTGSPHASKENLMKSIKQSIGFDLGDPKDRRELAISLYKVKNIDDLAKLMKAPPAMVHQYYPYITWFYDGYGRIEGLTSFFEILIDYEDFVIQSGFPTLPLKGNTSSLIVEKFEDWNRKFFDSPITSKGKFELAINAKVLLLPLGHSPEMVQVYVQKALYETDTLLELLCLEEDDMYKLLHKDFGLDMHQSMKESLTTDLAILTELDRMGIFSLK